MGGPEVDVGDYYDRFWSGQDPQARAEHDYRSFQVDLFAYLDSLLDDLTGCRALEIGPGLGLDTLRLAQRGAEVWAVDLAPASLRTVRRRAAAAGLADRVHVVRMNGESLALADASFDLVYVQCTLMHTDWRRVVRECWRVLRPGGRAIFVEPLRHHPLVALYRATLSRCRGSRPRYLSWWDFDRISRFFGRGNRRSFYLISPLALALRQTPLGRPLAPPLRALDRALLRLPFLRPLAWYVVAYHQR